jgi:hypothetical protein
MAASSTGERRQFPRSDARVLVSYGPVSGFTSCGVGYTRNVSEGGTVFTTSRPFDLGSKLALTLRFPFAHRATEQIAEVVSCRETVRNLIYETRIRFLPKAAEVA